MILGENFLFKTRYRRVAIEGLIPFLFGLTLATPPGTALKAPAAPPLKVTTRRSLAPGGTISLTANAGDVRIVRATQPDELKLEIAIETGRLDPAQAAARWVKVMRIDGRNAIIDLHLPADRTAGLVTLHVPSPVSLNVRLRRGRLTVASIEGRKDLEVASGTLTLREAAPAAYRHVTAKVKVGQINDGVFHAKRKGFIGQKMVAEGMGLYDLRLDVRMGEIVLTPEDGGF